MNNPFQFFQVMNNPHQFLQNMMGNSQIMNNPMAKNAMEMYQKGDTDGLKQMAENLCREKGMDPNEVLNKLKSNFGL